MTLWTKIKSWFAPKPALPELNPSLIVTLPNGRKALVDDKGNFVSFR
jgi:hypothetical protein